MSAELQKELEPTVPAAQVKFRVKRFPSLLDKVHQRFQGAAQFDPVWTLRALPDLLAMRAVCPFLEDVDAAIAAAGRRFEVLDVDHKGEDRAFSDFGYSSTHLTLSIPPEILREIPRLEGFRVELQIRTILQDAWAEVEHELIYKVGAHPLNLQIRRKLAALNANLVLSDTIFQEIRDYQKSNIADLARARTAFLEQAESERAHSPQVAAVSRLNQAEVERLLKKALNAQIAGEMDDAVRIYSQLTGMALDHFTMSVVLNHRGMALEALGRHTEAIGDFARSRELDPKNARARINLALSLRRDRRLEEAEAELRETLRIKPNSAHAHYGLARVLADQGDRDGALASCQRALQFNPGFNLPLKLMQELQAAPIDRAT